MNSSIFKIDSSKISTRELLNRETAWVQFNARVLEQAADYRLPLLERVRFLSIFTTNLDEFVMKRLGGLKRKESDYKNNTVADECTVSDQIAAIRETLLPLLKRQSEIYQEQILPELRENKIDLFSYADLSNEEQQWADNYFFETIYPLLKPFIVDEAHQFPFITNLSLSFGVALLAENGEKQFARIKLNGKMPYLIQVPIKLACGRYRFITIAEIVRQHLDFIFAGKKIIDVMLFRITRNAGSELQAEEESEDLLEFIERELKRRRFAYAVRLEYNQSSDVWIRDFIIKALDLKDIDVYEVKAELDYSVLDQIVNLPLPALKFPPFSAKIPKNITLSDNIFTVIRNNDLLVHHPYQSFSETVERFVKEAADDKAVRSIKMTVYRVGDEAPLLPLLIRAAANGKYVVCLVELMARFDEERNLQFAQTLGDYGVNIVYGVPSLKIHAKTLLVERDEWDCLRCYAHIGTGNYNNKTATLYTDLGLFTANPAYTQDAMDLFNFLTGRIKKTNYHKLLVAPFNIESRLIELIDTEIKNAKAGCVARIILKMNALDDIHIIEKLYEASCAGVEIDLIVRGVCCLRPAVKGLSENIRVRSIIGRFLEHSRIYYFAHGSTNPMDGVIFISSADCMNRNFHRRIEIAVPIESAEAKKICWHILEVMLADDVLSWQMLNDGTYRRCADIGVGTINTHEMLLSGA